MKSAPSVPGLDRDPFVGDRRVAGAHRVDRDEAAAPALELRDRDLQRIRVVVFGGADHHEQLRALEVRPAELPEAAADRVDHAGGHVHRAEAAVRRVVRRAEVAREQAGQRLHLVAAGEERELLRVGGADPRAGASSRIAKARSHEIGSNSPAPRSLPGLRSSGCVSRAGDTCFMIPAEPLAQITPRLIGWFGIAVDVARLAVAQVHADAAAAGAHVAGGRLDLALCAGVRRRGRVVQRFARKEPEDGMPHALNIVCRRSHPARSRRRPPCRSARDARPSPSSPEPPSSPRCRAAHAPPTIPRCAAGRSARRQRTGIHDVAPAPDGGVWFTAQRSGHLGWFDPKSGARRARRARRQLVAARRDPGARSRRMAHRRWPERDRPRRLARPHGARVPAPRGDAVREPQHRDLRRRRRPLVHGPERLRRQGRAEDRRGVGQARAARHRAVRHLHDAARRRLVLLAGRVVHRQDRPRDRRIDRRRATDGEAGSASRLERQRGPDLGQRMAERPGLGARPGEREAGATGSCRARARARTPSTSTSATRSG